MYQSIPKPPLLSDRFGEHRRAVEKAISQRDIDQATAVSDHFTLPGHSLNNLELIPLELQIETLSERLERHLDRKSVV